MLFSKLDIDFNNDGDFVKHGKRLFEEISRCNYYGIPVDGELLEEIRKNRFLYFNPLNKELKLTNFAKFILMLC